VLGIILFSVLIKHKSDDIQHMLGRPVAEAKKNLHKAGF